MFWSIILEPGKKYSTVVENTFHLSMATLDLKTVKNADDVHTVYVESDNNPRVVLCHLSKSANLFQCSLDHVFFQGTDLKFVTSASANIHMTGYIDMEDAFGSDLESEAEEEDEEEEISNTKSKQEKNSKRKAEENFPKKSKHIKVDESNDDSDDELMDFEDDSDDDENGLTISDLMEDEAEEGSDDDDDDDDDDEEEDDDDDDEDDDSDEVEDIPILKQSKKAKEQQKTPKKQVNGNEQKTPKGQEKTPKGQKTPMPKTPDANRSLINGSADSSKKNKNKEPKTPLDGLKNKKPDTPLPKDKQNQQQKLNGGVIINDLKVGEGAVAKPGKNVKVYYVGRLKSTGKVFDSMQKGPGFQFGLQRGEVIKGWDIGIAGMKVGGKRKVICPPNMAYGAKGSPPEIPPNSTLVFDVELKHVN